jgi:hypothetical protein
MLTSAKSPLDTAVVFIPKTRHVIEPDPFEQESDLPAAAAAPPTVALMEVTLAVGKLSDHSKLAGWAPPLELNVTETDTLPPGVLDADPILMATL